MLKKGFFFGYVIALLFFSNGAFAVNFYSNNTGDPNNVASWGQNTNGTGAAPSDFTSNNQVFILTNSNPGILTGPWTVSGTGSKVIVGEGLVAQSLSTSTFLIVGTFDVADLGTLNVQSNSSFTLGACASGSTVAYNGDLDQSVRLGTYHHLVLTNATTTKTKAASGAITVNGDFTVNPNNVLSMTTFLLSGVSGTISGGGSITTTNTSATPIPNSKTWTQTVTYSGATSGVASGTYENLIVSTAGTKTAQGSITVNASLNVSATLDMVTNTLSGAFTPSSAGTINTQNTGSTPLPAGKTWTQNITYNANASSQTVVKGIYNLALDVKGAGAGGSRTFPSGGDTIEVKGNFTANAASVTYTTTGTRFIFSGGAQTLTFISSSAFNFSYVSFTVASAFTKTIGGAGFGADSLNVGTLCTLAMVTFDLTGNLTFIGGQGIITTTSTNSTPLPTGKVWTQTVNYTGATQTIVTGTYANLTYAAGTKTAGGDLVVNTALTSTGTLELGTNTISGTFSSSGAGAINTQNTTATPIPAGKTWSQTLVYNATGAQTVVKGIYGGLNVTGTTSGATRTFPTNSDTIEVRGAFTAANTSGVAYNASGTRFLFTTATKNLTFDAGSTFNFGHIVFSGSFVNTVVGNGFSADTLNVATGATLTMSTFQLTGLNSITGPGTITTANTSSTPFPTGKNWSQNITYNAAGSQTVVSGIYTLALNVAGGSRTFANTGTIEVRGTPFTANTASVTYTTTGSAFLFSTAAQTLTFGTSTFNFNNVSFTGAFTKTIGGAGFSADTLIVGTGCTLAMVTFQLSGTLSSISGNGTITTTNTGATPLPTGKVWTQTVNYTGATQTIVTGTYANLTYAAGTKTAGGDLVVNTALTSTGTLELGTNTISGTFSSTGAGAINTQNTTATPIPAGKTWSQTLVYNATGAQTVVKGSYGGLNVTGTTSGATRTFPTNSDTIEVRGAFTAANTSGVAYNASGTRFLFTTATKNLTFDAGSTFNFGYIVFSGSFVNTVVGNGFSADTLNVATGATLTMSTFQLTGLNSITGPGTITTANTSSTPLPAGKNWSQAITYNSSSNQTVVKGIYSSSLIITGTTSGATRTFPTNSDTIEVRGAAFTAANTSGVAYNASGTRFIISSATKTLTFNAGSTFNFGNVLFTGAFTNTIAGSGFSADTLNVATGTTLAMITFPLSGTLNSIAGQGTITTTHTATAAPIPAGKIWSQNITYSATTTQTVVKGTYLLALNVAGGVGSRTFPSGGDTIEVRGNFTASAASVTYTTTGTRFIFSGGAQTLTFVATSPFNFGYVSFTGTSITKTIGGAAFNVDTLNVASTVTLNMATLAMGGNVLLTSGSGTITTQHVATALPLPSGKTWIPMVSYNDASTTQTVVGGIYQKLGLSQSGNTGRTKSVTGNVTVNDTLTLTNSGSGTLITNFQGNRFIAGGGFLLVASSGLHNIQTASTDVLPLPSGITWPTSGVGTITVTYNATADQTVVLGTYFGLTFSGSGNRNLASGDIDITGAFTASAGPTIVGGSSNVKLTGAAQTIILGASGSFNNFRAKGTGNKTITAATGALSVNGILEVDTLRSLIMNDNQLSGTITSTSGTGTITTTSTATAPIPAGKTWTQNITYSATVSQNVVKGIYTATLNVAGGVGTRVFPSGRDTVEVRGNFTANAASVTYTTLGTRFIFSGAAQTLTFVATSTFNFGYVSFTGLNVTKTVATAGFSVDTLKVDSGTTLNMAALAIGGNITVTTGKGTIRTQHATAAFATGKTWVPLVNFDADATQNVIGGTYTKLTISILTTARTKTATADITVNDTMVYSSTGSAVLTFSMSTFRLIDGGGFFLNSVGTGLKSTTTNYANNDTAFKPLPSNQTWPGIVTYGSASHQTVVAGTYMSSVTISGGNRTFSATDTIEIKGTFTAASASTYTTTGTTLLFSGAAQTLTLVASPVISFNNLSFTGSSVTKTMGAGFNVNGKLNIDTTVTLAMVTFSMGGNPTVISGAGIITTQAITLALPAGEIWTQTVNYNYASNTQNIIGGRYANLSLSITGNSARIKTATDSITVNNNLTFTTTGTTAGTITLAMGVFRLIDGGAFNLVNSGVAPKLITTSCSNTDTTFKPIPSNQTWPGSVTYGAIGHQTVVAGIYTGALVVSGGSRTFSGTGIIEVRGAFTANTPSTTYTNIGSSFLFSVAGQTLSFVASSVFTFNNVSFTGAGTTKLIAGAGFSINGLLNIDTMVTLNMAALAMGGNPTTISGKGIITTQAIAAALPVGETWTQTVTYNTNANQAIIGGTYYQLNINAVSTSTRIKTVTGADLQVNDTFALATTGVAILTLEMGANRLIAGPSFFLSNSGTTVRNINTQSTASLPLPSGLTWPTTSTVTYNATSGTQTVSSGEYTNLTLSSTSGKVAGGNITVNGILNLASNNASTSLGCLDMGTSILTMGALATTTGTSDVTGIVKRTTLAHSTGYTFGNQFSRITFQNAGTLPSEISVRIKLGTAAGWKQNSILRQYELIQTGASGTQATIRFKYIDAEMNSNIENRLVFWRDSMGTITELGRTTNDATNNYIELAPIDISVYPSSFGSDTLTIANTQNLNSVWEGSISNSWNNALNWNNSIIPDSVDNVTIPDSATTSFDPQVPATARVRRLSIEDGGYMDCVSAAALSVHGSDSSGILAWDNTGSFIAGNSTVTFSGAAASFNGTTTFNNIVIQAGAKLTNISGSLMRIAGSFTRSGTWEVDSTSSTVEYSGSAAQTLINPNGVFSGYDNLILSGSGAKTFPGSMIIKGNWTNNSTSGTAGDVLFNGSTNQQISGSQATTFTKFTVNNGNSVILSGVGVTINDSLVLSNGIFDLNGSSITLAGTVSGAGTIAGSTTSSISITGSGALGTLLFTPGNDSVNNFTMNRTTGTAVLGSDLTIVGNIALTTTELSIGANTLTVNGNYTATSSSLTGSSSSHLNFSGTGTPTSNISFTSGARTLNSFTINRAATITLGTDITLADLALTSGVLSLNNNDITISGETSGSGTITGNTTSNMSITGTGSLGTIAFTSGGRSLNNLTLNRTGSGSATLASDLSISGTLTLTEGLLEMGSNTLTLNGDFSGNSSGVLTGNGTGSNLTIAGTGSLGDLFFDQTTDGTTNEIATLIVNRSGLTANIGNNLHVATALTLTSGKLGIGSNRLSIGGAITSTASNSLVSNASSNLDIEGSGSMGTSIFFDQSTPDTTNRLANLSFDRSGQTITLGNALQVTGIVTPVAGTLASAGNLTLISTASATASIADGGCTTCNYITGNVTIQRYIPSVARRFRFLGSPVKLTTLADWQAEVYITGPGGATNGFDATSSNAPSLYSYNETLITGDLNIGWQAAAKISDTLVVGKGVRMFIRGDRSDPGRLTGSVIPQNEVTLDLVGVPNQGDITMPVSCTFSGPGNTFVSANDGWNLVANPYASPYDWDAHYSNGSFNNNIDPSIWILDAQNNGYISYNALAHAGDLEEGIIPPGASFWVKANAASPVLTFKEQFKIDTIATPVYVTKQGENFTIKLYFDSVNSDKAVVKYLDEAIPDYDNYDIRKLVGAVTISSYGSDSIQLGLNSRPTTLDPDTIKLRVSAPTGSYKLMFANSSTLPVADNVLLFDTYTSTVTDLKVTDVYNFSIVSAVPESQGTGRFYIVIGNSDALPVHLLQFAARKVEKSKVRLNWSTAQEVNSKSFEIERSADGKIFKTIASVDAGGNTQKVINYMVVDHAPARVNYYRLKQIDFDGSVAYSQVQFITMDEAAGAKVYPIPAHTTLTIEHANMLTGVRIFDISGRLISTQSVFNSTVTVDVNTLETGVYIVEYTDELGQTYKEKFTKE